MLWVRSRVDRISVSEEAKDEETQAEEEGEAERKPDAALLGFQMHEPRANEADLEGSDSHADLHVHAVTAEDVVKVHIRKTDGDECEYK